MSQITPQGHVLGWSRELPDHRDYLYSAPAKVMAALPSKADLRPQMPLVYDQGPIGSCHDDQTDVLTDAGWKRFADLDGSERLASIDPVNGKLIFEIPTRLIRFPYTGQLHCCHNMFLDFRVTPDHQMLVRKWNENKRTLDTEYQLIAAKDLGWYSGLLNRVKWEGETTSTVYTLPGVDHKHIPQRSPRDVPLSAWMRFLGIYLAEGTLIKPHNGAKHYKVQIAASKEREKAFVRQTMADIGVSALELDDRFTFENKQVYQALVGLGLAGKEAPEKFVPAFVFRQNAEMIQEFLAGHFAGDGSEQNGNRAHYTSSAKLADDLHALIFMSGQETRLAVREARSSMMADGRTIIGVYPEHRVSVCEKRNLSIERKSDIVLEDYDGEVFCAEVPTFHTLVTRREGTILVSGNCTANAIAGAVQFDRLKMNESPDFVPSRLFIYYNERAIERSIPLDAGAIIRDGIKVVAGKGVPDEALWPYVPTSADPSTNLFPVGSPPATNPPSLVYGAAWHHKALTYSRVAQTLSQLKGCLAEGYPFVFGFTVYSNIYDANGEPVSVLNMPSRSDQILGGHAVLAVGYDDSSGTFIIRNSWGANVMDHGYFHMKYGYVTDSQLSNDFWTIRTESS